MWRLVGLLNHQGLFQYTDGVTCRTKPVVALLRFAVFLGNVAAVWLCLQRSSIPADLLELKLNEVSLRDLWEPLIIAFSCKPHSSMNNGREGLNVAVSTFFFAPFTTDTRESVWRIKRPLLVSQWLTLWNLKEVQMLSRGAVSLLSSSEACNTNSSRIW